MNWATPSGVIFCVGLIINALVYMAASLGFPHDKTGFGPNVATFLIQNIGFGVTIMILHIKT